MVTDIFTLLADWTTATFTVENHTLTNIASALTAGVLIIAPLTYVIKRRWTNNTERKDISKSLYEELKNGMEALDGTAKRQVMEIKIKDVKRYYTLTFMNYDMYDSLIFSGKIQILNHDLQQKIQDIFRRIKGHQEYLKYTARLRDNAKLQNINMDETTTPYYELIANYESELEDLIPKVMKELEKNF